jgi:predicted unusual protein kinase regulating ubiquinone biosynthesis (AarF/ABC1/UbiB family)
VESDKRSRSGALGGGIEQGRLRRAAPLVGLAARSGAAALVARLRQSPGASSQARSERYERDAARYAELLGRSKGVLMKVGQMLSIVSFGTAVPPEQRAVFQGALSRLQMNAPPMAPELAVETVGRELGRPCDKVFAHFDEVPLAAASIGQVHRASLHDGREVAVKVQYPGVARAIEADLQNTELLAAFLQLLRSFVPGVTRLDVRGAAAEVAARLHEELDYRQEASNQAEFADLYRGHPFIHVPDVIAEYCTERVLVQELVTSGRRWPEPLDANQELRDLWGEILFRFSIGHLRRHCRFNADPHPGNYFFHDDGTVTFVDFGCVKRFPPARVALISAIIIAVLHDDRDHLWQLHVDAGILDRSDPISPQRLLGYWHRELAVALAPQPFTVTPEFVSGVLRNSYSPLGPSGDVVRHSSMPSDMLFLTRIDMGVFSLLGELGATADWRALTAEFDEGAPPATALGRADEAFWGSRVGP